MTDELPLSGDRETDCQRVQTAVSDMIARSKRGGISNRTVFTMVWPMKVYYGFDLVRDWLQDVATPSRPGEWHGDMKWRKRAEDVLLVGDESEAAR